MTRQPYLTYIFRKRTPANFSIEKLFEVLYAHFDTHSGTTGIHVRRIELPLVSTGILSVLRNIWFVRGQQSTPIIHITGDVHYAALFRPFSRTIVTVHDCVVLQRGTGLKRFAFWVLWFWLPVRFAAAVTVISEQTKRELLATVSVPERKVTVIPNFVDRAFAFSEREFATAKPRILHIGTTPNKNLARVIRSLCGVSCTLVIVGKLPAEILLDLTNNSTEYENHVGVGEELIRALYQSADIISFPSTYEGFGMPILEGQATGRPILTSNLDPMRAVAGPGGALGVDPYSVEAIREGFLAIMGDAELRAKLVSAGRINCAKFSLEAVSQQYHSLYRQMLDSEGLPGAIAKDA